MNNNFPLLIAEIANCHAGDSSYLSELVGKVCSTSVEAVKFQLIIADELLVPHHSQYRLFKSFEFPFAFWEKTVGKVKSARKKVIFDIFGDRSLVLAARLKTDMFKVYASDIDDIRFIKRVLTYKKKVFVSTGGADLAEIEKVVKLPGSRNICFLVGFQSFPTPIEESQLNKIDFLRRNYGCHVGFMDHCDSTDDYSMYLSCIAIAKGACSIEKHVYLPNKKKTYDWQSSISPVELDRLNALLIKTQKACGTTDGFELTKLEKEYFKRKRKIAVAARKIEPGERFSEDLVAFKLGEVTGKQECMYRRDMEEFFGKHIKCSAKKDRIFLRSMFRKE